ncbi:UNVERIFIED_CONTAM: hypothetical protein K2H54_001165 [Gekko kuhli]
MQAGFIGHLYEHVHSASSPAGLPGQGWATSYDELQQPAWPGQRIMYSTAHRSCPELSLPSPLLGAGGKDLGQVSISFMGSVRTGLHNKGLSKMGGGIKESFFAFTVTPELKEKFLAGEPQLQQKGVVLVTAAATET